MKSMTTHTGKLEIVRRLSQTKAGNPRWIVRVDGWTCRTMPDAWYTYQILNLEGKTVKATIGTHYGCATLAEIQKA